MFLGTLVSLALIAGGAVFGRAFYAMIYTFLTTGVPAGWTYVSASPYWHAFKTGVKLAITLPIAGTILGLVVSRVSPDAGQMVILTTILPAFIVQLAILKFANVFGGIAIFFIPASTDAKQDAADAHYAITRYAWMIFAVELYVAFVLVAIGVYASAFVLFGATLLAVGYGVITHAYGIPVSWGPKFMANSKLIALFGLAVIVVLFAVPQTRPYMLSVLNPAKFLNPAVIDTNGDFSDAKEVAKRQMLHLCQGNKVRIKDAIKKEGDLTKVLQLKKELNELEQQCLSFKF